MPLHRLILFKNYVFCPYTVSEEDSEPPQYATMTDATTKVEEMNNAAALGYKYVQHDMVI